MEIPMAKVIESYRSQLSEALHQITLQTLHIKSVEELLAEAKEKQTELQATIDMYEIAASAEDLNHDPDDWKI